MTVVDASVLANAVGDDGHDGRIARLAMGRAETLSAPDLVDVETTSALRKRWLAGDLPHARLVAAVADLGEIPLQRYPALPLLGRALELKANVTVYDAVYVALAELLGCALLTSDLRLASAPGIRCSIEILKA